MRVQLIKEGRVNERDIENRFEVYVLQSCSNPWTCCSSNLLPSVCCVSRFQSSISVFFSPFFEGVYKCRYLLSINLIEYFFPVVKSTTLLLSCGTRYKILPFHESHRLSHYQLRFGLLLGCCKPPTHVMQIVNTISQCFCLPTNAFKIFLCAYYEISYLLQIFLA